MPRTDWLQKNDYRAYPLVENDFTLSPVGSSSSGMPEELPRRGLVDAGFVLGINSHFELGEDTVYLHSVIKTAGSVTFRFRANYSENARDFLRCYEWLFEFELDTPFGATRFVDATHIDTGLSNPLRGQGFVTIGNLNEIADIMDGEWLLVAQPEVEPGLLQSLVNTYAKSINAANEPRPCPPECPCPPSSSSSPSASSLSSSSLSSPSSSSSSESSASSESSSLPSEEPCDDPPPIVPDPDFAAPVALPESTEYLGHVKLKPGFNCRLTVSEDDNAIEIGAGEAYGEGQQCTTPDLRTDDDGVIREDACLPCKGPIYTVNSQADGATALRLVGGPGVVIIPRPSEHEILISLDEEGICEL